MSQATVLKSTEARKLLTGRVASRRYVNRSARRRDLRLYTTARVLRVHASMLRKRLEPYFAEEGSGEPLILEVPKGNSALVFHTREEMLPATVGATAPLLPRAAPSMGMIEASRPDVTLFWSLRNLPTDDAQTAASARDATILVCRTPGA
ncbi:MAG TPA: hypothetical protein VGF49_02985 [Candidatus Solibacter sp.]|jgi:hypothetical protein